MTATFTRTVPSTATQTDRSACTPTLWRTGLAAGVAAAAATVVVAVLASAGNVSLETEPGKAIPALGFGQLTLFFTAIGVLIARTIGRRAAQPRSAFLRVTIALTALSMVPDVMLSADVATKVILMLTHVVAAAIVIPPLACRLPERVTR